jgi:hypothetical protein
VQNVDWTKVRFAIPADPRCLKAPAPKTPVPLGAWRFPPDPTVGKAIWFSASTDTSGCPIYYDVEVELTDGQGARAMILQVPQEDANVSWIPRPPGVFQLNFHVTDPGTRGAWASYGVWTQQYRARAYNAGGAMSAWSEWFAPGYEPCVAGACGDFP